MRPLRDQDAEPRLKRRQSAHLRGVHRRPSISLVRNTLWVIHALPALACLDGAPFDVVFGGGATLARAHRVIWRTVDGVDFKTVPDASTPMGRSARRRQLDRSRPHVSAAVQAAGFALDPADNSVTSGDGRWVLAEALFAAPP